MTNTLSHHDPNHGFPYGVMFHRFRGTENNYAVQGAIRPDDLAKIIDHLGPDNFISPQEWVDRLGKGSLAPHHRCLTFDDGLLSQYEYALPVIESYGLKAFWFIYTCVLENVFVYSEIIPHAACFLGGFNNLIDVFLQECPYNLGELFNTVEFQKYEIDTRSRFPFYSQKDIKYRFVRNKMEPETLKAITNKMLDRIGISEFDLADKIWMKSDHLKDLDAKGHMIGLHTNDHPLETSKLSPQEQKTQYTKNYNMLSSILNMKPSCMSHPLGSYSEITLLILAEMGIKCGFRSDIKPPQDKDINAGSLELAREDAANILAAIGDNTN